MSKTSQDLAQINATLLRDTELGHEAAPLVDNTVAIQERFATALAALLARITHEVHERYGKRYPILGLPVYTTKTRKNARFTSIWEHSNDRHQGPRIVGFVENGTGLMWKAATWRAPALNYPRGCIFDLDAIPVGELAGGSFDGISTKISLEADGSFEMDLDAFVVGTVVEVRLPGGRGEVLSAAPPPRWVRGHISHVTPARKQFTVVVPRTDGSAITVQYTKGQLLDFVRLPAKDGAETANGYRGYVP